MIYYSNHSYCNESNWGGMEFNGEVVVSIQNTLSNDFLTNNKLKIKNPDFEAITKKNTVFDQDEYEISWPLFKEHLADKLKDMTEKEISDFSKKPYFREVPAFKQEVLDWLEDNVKDNINTDQNTPIHERKAWAVGTDKYNLTTRTTIDVFFSRQKDALRFIRQWSVYKEPISYFDYFHDDRREMHINKVIELTNNHLKESNQDVLDIGDKIKVPHAVSTILDEDTFKLIDWEKEEE